MTSRTLLPRRSGLGVHARGLLLTLGVPVGAVVLWQFAAQAHSSVFFPPPTRIVGRAHHLWFSGPAGQLFLTDGAVANVLPSIGRPALLLMDEPFGALDAQTREDLEDLLLRLHRADGMTVLLVTHDIDESVYVGDRVVVLTPGPGRVRNDLPVRLPVERDQTATRRLPEFTDLRTEVSRAIRLGTGADPPAQTR